MERPANSTSHRMRAHGLRPARLIAEYHLAHPGQVSAVQAARLAEPSTVPLPLVEEPATAGIPRILLQALAPVPAVAR